MNFHPRGKQYGFRMAVFRFISLEVSGEIDVIGGNLADCELGQNIIAVEEAEQLVCGPVVQLFSCVGIDVIHHKVDFRLGKEVKGSSFGKVTPDHFVSYFAGPFLIRTLGVTEEDAGTEFAGCHVAFNRHWVSKPAASVCKDDGKK